MALPVTIPNTFANATSSIPLSQLDTNFSTLANAVNGLNSGSETLANLKATTANVGVLTVTGNATIGDASTDTVTLNSTLTANTAVIFAAGTSAAPSITTTGDTNTGIFFPAADTIAFAEGGAEIARFDSSGNFGIGTNSPSSRLDVSGVLSFQGTTLPSAGTARIFNRSSDSGFYLQGATGGTTNLLDGSQNTMAVFGSSTVQFMTANTERMRIDSSGNLIVGATSASRRFWTRFDSNTVYSTSDFETTSLQCYIQNTSSTIGAYTGIQFGVGTNGDAAISAIRTADGECALAFGTRGSGTRPERMRIDSSGNVQIGTTTVVDANSNVLTVGKNSTSYDAGVVIRQFGNGTAALLNLIANNDTGAAYNHISSSTSGGTTHWMLGGVGGFTGGLAIKTSGTERARITSGGELLVGKTTAAFGTAGVTVNGSGATDMTVSGDVVLRLNRLASDGILQRFAQDSVSEGDISVSGTTVSYNSFCGGHWTQLQEGRGYNPDIPRGTVMSSIGEMAEWKSVTWTEMIEHPAIPAVEAKEAVLDEEGNVVEPAVEAVEGKDAWTESIPHREEYLGSLPIGATFEEDGFTKTVVDDGNERLPKVKISNVVGDKAVYGVFQTWDEVQDMVISAVGAFVVRIAAGVTVQIGDLLESNGDGCAKVQDDDVIRSKTIGKVTSTVATATYADGSYTVPCVLYCG